MADEDVFGPAVFFGDTLFICGLEACRNTSAGPSPIERLGGKEEGLLEIGTVFMGFRVKDVFLINPADVGLAKHIPIIAENEWDL